MDSFTLTVIFVAIGMNCVTLQTKGFITEKSVKTHHHGGGGTEMPNKGWERVRLDSEKKIVTSPKLGLFLGRKAQEVRQFYCSSECVVVVQVDFF